MKIYKFITQISIAGCMLVGTPMLQGCMDNSLNDPLGKFRKKNLDEMDLLPMLSS